MSGYFLYHSIGTFPGKADAMAAALSNFAVLWSAEDDGQWPAAMAARRRFIESWERLLQAPAGSLTTAENVTAALYSLIGGLPAEHLAGRRCWWRATVSPACISCWPALPNVSASRSTPCRCAPAKAGCATRISSPAGRTMSGWRCSPSSPPPPRTAATWRALPRTAGRWARWSASTSRRASA